jgi:hypothetical protein
MLWQMLSSFQPYTSTKGKELYISNKVVLGFIMKYISFKGLWPPYFPNEDGLVAHDFHRCKAFLNKIKKSHFLFINIKLMFEMCFKIL